MPDQILSQEEIDARAQTDRMYDAATKTWRDATFTVSPHTS